MSDHEPQVTDPPARPRRLAPYDLVLLKTVRWTGWPLLVLVGLYILTGYVLCGKYGFDRIVSPQTVLPWHRMFDSVLVLLVLLHSVPAAVLALRRWGWIR
jgi:hypothetical protein